MKIQVREAMNLGVWIKLCDIKGINVFALNEGLIDEEDYITITLEEARQLGFFNKEV